jgi:hypothetical protein
MSLSNLSVSDLLLPPDEFLTPGNIAFTSQDSDDEDTSVFKTFCMTVDKSNAGGMKAAPNDGDERKYHVVTCVIECRSNDRSGPVFLRVRADPH